MGEQLVTDELLRKYLRGKCTPEEQERIAQFLSEPEHAERLHRIMEEETTAIWEIPANEKSIDDTRITGWQQTLQDRIKNDAPDAGADQGAKVFRLSRKGMRYAAAVIGLIFISSVLWYTNLQHHKNQNELALQKQQVLPGSDKALLTLSNGKTISLSDAAKGKITGETGVNVQKTADGELVYQADHGEASANVYNTVETPNGGQYRIVLPDGSKAWLNAGSSLTYPVHFQSDKRTVKMTGEVYFEIAKIKSKTGPGNVPFIVSTDQQQIQVLGTHFNVNAYADEPAVRTTLVEGSVQVTALHSGHTVLLKPGQQAILNDQLHVETADIRQELAWTNGDFIFQNESLDNILRQISRWYDIEVDCPPRLGQLRLNAMISRSKPISTIIDIIEITHRNKIKLALNGRRLTVKD